MSETGTQVAKTVVAIISSNYLLRLGLQRIVEAEPWIKLIGQTAHGANLNEVLIADHPDIAILDTENDYAIPDFVREIRNAVPAIKIILLSVSGKTHLNLWSKPIHTIPHTLLLFVDWFQ